MVDSVKGLNSLLSLSEAQRLGQIEDFILQEEVRGIGPAATQQLEDALSRVIKGEKSTDQTSHSASRDGSSGK